MAHLQLFPTPHLSQWIIMGVLLLAALPLHLCECPEEGTYKYGSNSCFRSYKTTYNSHLSAYGNNFFTGIDVESVRLICNALKTSLSCVYRSRQNCEDQDISPIVAEYRGVAQLCLVKNIYEVYAMSQFCFVNLAVTSESCYEGYSTRVMGLLDDVELGERTATDNMCQHLRRLKTCISNNVRGTCGTEAAELVPPLVDASIQYSERCIEASTTTSTTDKTTTAGKDRPTVASLGAQESTNSAYKCSPRLLLLTIMAMGAYVSLQIH